MSKSPKRSTKTRRKDSVDRGVQGSKRPVSSSKSAGSQSPPRSKASTSSGNREFIPEVLDRTVIAIPLLRWFEDPKHPGPYDIVVDLNLNYRGGLKGARDVVERRVDDIIRKRRATDRKTRIARS